MERKEPALWEKLPHAAPRVRGLLACFCGQSAASNEDTFLLHTTRSQVMRATQKDHYNHAHVSHPSPWDLHSEAPFFLWRFPADFFPFQLFLVRIPWLGCLFFWWIANFYHCTIPVPTGQLVGLLTCPSVLILTTYSLGVTFAMANAHIPPLPTETPMRQSMHVFQLGLFIYYALITLQMTYLQRP